ncbi:hypothetical protein EST38_g2208 [Candolleomyces aberdarensis]|uniref:EKC/KEOPS complex subunit CGI121 n=1 Tax=Candolleomyces aberdarensis TaxID=2316362 RepID=A0A4Q2DTG7_9AGAR|nr:hypothetical protein EST38_g2208 [Candolleomyces aberdarensis]
MQSTTFPHVPHDRSSARYALFRNVENAPALRQRIIKASTMQGRKGELEKEAVNFAFIDARLVAIHQAILADSANPSGLKTKSVHSEVLFNLNPTNNITEALRNYGISDTSTDLVVVRIGSPDVPDNAIQELMKDVVIGNIVEPFETELEQLTDWGLVKRYFKLSTEPALKDLEGQAEREAVDKIVTSSVAMKSVGQ